MDKRQFKLEDFINDIEVFGFQPASCKDFPGRVSSVFFLKYCNLKCPYCHNYNTMNKTDSFTPDMLKAFISDALSNRLSSGIVITGGEPTVYEASLVKFLYFLRNYSKAIKLDTNGTNTNIIEYIIKHKLVDFIAMDIKHKFEAYPTKLSYKYNVANLYDSVELIRRSGIAYEFRTTVNPDVDTADLEFIAKWFPEIKFQEYKTIKE